MGVHRVAEGIPRDPLTPEEDKAFGDATVIFVGVVLSVLGDKLVDAYLHIRNGKELWDALDAKFDAADAGGELYAMEQFNDYRMVENRYVVEQAHEIQIMAKELELLKCVLPDKFVAGFIVAKLSPSWRNFSTSLKHQRHEFSVENIMGSLDVEEKARAKDKHTRGTEGRYAANMVQKNAHKSKGKNKGVSQTTNFKKKGKRRRKILAGCVARQAIGLIAVHNVKERNVRLDITQILSAWSLATQRKELQGMARGSSVMMGNGLHAIVHSVGTVDLKFTSGKIVQLKNVLHVPSIKKNLVSGFRLMKDGFKLVFESNKVVLTKYGTFVGKGYECEGMLRFSLKDFCDNVVNHMARTRVTEARIQCVRNRHADRFVHMTKEDARDTLMAPWQYLQNPPQYVGNDDKCFLVMVMWWTCPRYIKKHEEGKLKWQEMRGGSHIQGSIPVSLHMQAEEVRTRAKPNVFGLIKKMKQRKTPHPETGSLWVNPQSETQCTAYVSKFKQKHSESSNPEAEDFDPEVAVLAGEGMKHGRLCLGDGCVDPATILSLRQIRRGRRAANLR
ncbi:hypothetical protein QYE76_029265 [Lolium multiflorum]|uniref:Retrovirus-related Pol polyprotein from transposon TNT 1-94-like beta-barrel domain-containing protein n=1 Tax=Lolium multiflorum TaxID=4521 RepID=A0AAD8QQ49_LOLMU|nr:hypothetical protein QYE76_029265 [Lolium multiflorum]